MPMVLIISNSGGSVNNVIDWITSQGIIVHKINPNFENVQLKEIRLTNHSVDIEITFEDDNITTKLSDYKGIWIWHADLRFKNCESIELESESNPIIDTISQSLGRHHKTLIDYFGSFLNFYENKTIGNFSKQNLNKLEVLLKAKDIGIEIPETYVVSKRKNLLNLLEKHPLITKPCHEVSTPIYNDIPFQNYTSTVTKSMTDDLEDDLFPTLVQESIDKLFEIRSFFLKGSFYSMAIFSQLSSQTQLDFRNYDFEKPNRTVPFKIPSRLEKKLTKLFKTLNINSGSFDMIFTKDNRYKFLEINPVGQFGMTSFPCNYYLEEVIMQKLINGGSK